MPTPSTSRPPLITSRLDRYFAVNTGSLIGDYEHADPQRHVARARREVAERGERLEHVFGDVARTLRNDDVVARPDRVESEVFDDRRHAIERRCRREAVRVGIATP